MGRSRLGIWGFPSYTNNFFCRVKVKKVCKTVHNSVLIYFRTSQPFGHPKCLCSLHGKLDVSRDLRSLFYNARCEDDNSEYPHKLDISP